MYAFNPALGRQRQVGLYEFEASLAYRTSFRTARATQRNSISKNKTNKQIKRKKEKMSSKVLEE